MTDFVEPATGIFVEDAFRHLLSREAVRATRYQDFFSVCLVRADTPEDDRGEDIYQAVSGKIAQFLRSTDVVGRVEDGIAILLLHTEGNDAVRVAERLRAHIEQVSFLGDSGSPRQITLSVGGLVPPRWIQRLGLALPRPGSCERGRAPRRQPRGTRGCPEQRMRTR